MSGLMTFDALAGEILAVPRSVRLVAVDGPGGSGKSTFAARLARAAGDAPVVHTDDFASWDEPLNWWPRLLAQVVEPLMADEPARYQRYDWVDRQLAEWHSVPAVPLVIIEGVSSGRSEWSRHLAYVCWLETDRAVRLRRGLDRDGAAAGSLWDEWMANEDRHFARDDSRARADVVVDGNPRVAHDAEVSFVALARHGRHVREPS